MVEYHMTILLFKWVIKYHKIKNTWYIIYNYLIYNNYSI